ncbi:MAG: serine O-acetyltransferase [Elusimicrobia bacterium]|nr:serine O-acetyltransferase [Elusimicrobiota bacterium]
MIKILREEVKNIFKKDPAAKSTLEVLLCYPGLHAIILYRIANWFWQKKFYFLGRYISHIARFLTGIEIHPGATIGKNLFIDHGMGVVIGETAIVGNGVLIYKGVVLGGTSLEKTKRHPTLGDNIVIGSNAIVLGDINIGNNAIIGAGSVVTHDVPESCTAVGVPARVSICHSPDGAGKLDHAKLHDHVSHTIKYLIEEQQKLQARLDELTKSKK